MKTLNNLLALSYLALGGSALSNTSKSPADSAIYSLGVVMSEYSKAHEGAPPSSWYDLISTNFLEGSLLESARHSIDFENRYFFPEDAIIPDGNGKSLKIIVMAKAPGAEGNNEFLGGSSGLGRYLIAQDSDGDIRTFRYREEILAKRFSSVGLDISNYTLQSQNVPRERRERHSNDQSHDAEYLRKIELVNQAGREATATAAKKNLITRLDFWAYGFGTVLLLLAILLLLRKTKMTTS